MDFERGDFEREFTLRGDIDLLLLRQHFRGVRSVVLFFLCEILTYSVLIPLLLASILLIDFSVFLNFIEEYSVTVLFKGLFFIFLADTFGDFLVKLYSV